jgi:hypothetical protein
MKIAIVTGSRDWQDREALWRALDDEHPDIVVHGSCETVVRGERRMRGADLDADLWARMNGVMLLTAPAHFDRLGGKAGPIRNSFIAKVVAAILAGWPGQPHQVVVIAAPLPGSRGTPDMVQKCERRQWRVRVVTTKHEEDGR